MDCVLFEVILCFCHWYFDSLRNQKSIYAEIGFWNLWQLYQSHTFTNVEAILYVQL
jgi:hypothetical protein